MRLRKHSMTKKIFFLFLAVILTVCVAVSVLDYSIERERRIDALYNSGSILAQSVLQDVTSRAVRVETIASELAFDRSVQYLMNERSVGSYIISLLFRIQSRMDMNEANLSDLSADLLLLLQNEEMPEAYGQAVRIGRYQNNDYFQAFLQSEARTAWENAGTAPAFTSLADQQVIAFNRKIMTGPNALKGVVRCQVPTDKMFANGLLKQTDAVLTICRGNEIIYSNAPGQDTLKTDEWKDRMLLDGYMIIRNEIALLDMSLLLKIPAGSVFEEAAQNTALNMLFVFLSGLLLLLVAMIVVSHMTGRLEKMTDAVQHSQDSDSLRRLLPEPGHDEAGQLSAAFQNLLQRNDEAYVALLQEEKGKQVAQSMALQYQMNPHFLFNSLYWLQLQMELRGADVEISNAVACLGGVLHYNLQGDTEATIGEEKEHIKAYVAFMQAMTGDKIVLCVEAAPEMEDYRILRFTLQPLLENAVKHGHIDGQTLHIDVSFFENTAQNSLVISVCNDGKIMTPEQASEIRNKLDHPPQEMKDGHGIALINLKKRIDLMYGTKGGIEFAEGGRNTCIRLRLPLDTCRINSHEGRRKR